MEPSEIQYKDDELTIDVKHLVISAMKKWRSLLAFVLLGALLGTLLPWLTPDGEKTRSREDAALVERMKVAAAARSQYEELRRYVENSPFMALDSQNVFTGETEYYIPKCEDPDRIAAGFGAVLKDEAVRSTLCEILGISDEMDLDKMLKSHADVKTDTKIVGDMQVELKEKLTLTVSVYAANRDQARQALDFLCQTLEGLPEVGRSFQLVQISRNVQAGVASSLRDAQNELRSELNEAHENYTDLEAAFNEAQYDLYETFVLTGKTNELPTELFPSNPLKMPVILAALFGFLAFGWYAAACVLSPKAETADQVTGIIGGSVLAFIDGSVPRKNPLDRWLDSLEMGSFPEPVSPAYAAAAAEKIGNAVAVCDGKEEGLRELVREMGIRSMDLLSRDPRTLENLREDDNVILLVKLGSTTKMQLQQETTLCRRYGIPLAGCILVK